MTMQTKTRLLAILGGVVLATSGLCGEPDRGKGVLATFLGTAFSGGAWQRFGATQYGLENTNYIYAKPTGVLSSVRAEFTLRQVPDRPKSLVLIGRDDDYDTSCRIDLQVNGHSLHRGESGFADDAWQIKRFAIPVDLLRKGLNSVVVTNLHETGNAGLPPWFMLVFCAVADADYVPPVRSFIKESPKVVLPDARRPFPEPLAEPNAKPGFAIRGTKGWGWTAEQYLEEIPFLAAAKMNFLMNCYFSMYSGHPSFLNEWWKPIPASRRAAYRRVIRACRERNITYCFAAHPQLHAPRRLDPNSDPDFAAFAQHFDWAQ